MTGDVLLRADQVSVEFPLRSQGWRRKGTLRAVSDANVALRSGETLGLLGESGSGKTTLGYTAIGHIRPTSGRIVYRETRDIQEFGRREWKQFRKNVQMVFQGSTEALNPRMTVREIVCEPMVIHQMYDSRDERVEEAAALLQKCGLGEKALSRYPQAFSGGQRQRIVIARALACRPEAIIADEPTSALDVSIQVQVLDLLKEIQEEAGIAILLISHDLGVIRHMADRAAVMRRGRVVESGFTQALFEDPKDDYTKELLSSTFSLSKSIRKQSREIEAGDALG